MITHYAKEWPRPGSPQSPDNTHRAKRMIIPASPMAPELDSSSDTAFFVQQRPHLETKVKC